MLNRILGLLLFAAILGIIAFNFKGIMAFSQAHLVENTSQKAIQAQNWEKAIELYENALKASPDNVDIALRLGWLYQKGHHPEKAEQIYRSILKLHPDSLDARMGLGMVLSHDAARLSEAVNEYRAALKAHPNDPKLLSQIGDMYKNAAENPLETRDSVRKWLYDQARYYYENSLKKDPKQFQAQFNVGVAYQEQQNLQPAAQAYCQAVVLKPDSYEARFNLGMTLTELNYLDEAYRQMERAVQLASEKSGEETAMAVAQRVQNVKNNIYNNPQKQGLQSRENPTFLNPACLFHLENKDGKAAR